MRVHFEDQTKPTIANYSDKKIMLLLKWTPSFTRQTSSAFNLEKDLDRLELTNTNELQNESYNYYQWRLVFIMKIVYKTQSKDLTDD